MIDPRAMIQTMISLASASLGLVAALAWNEAIKATLKQPVIIDGRNLYEPAYMRSLGIEYYGVGRGAGPGLRPSA